jgi:hypothetical protein
MAFQIKLSQDAAKIPQFKAIIYGNAGDGKSTCALSLLKSDLKMVLFAPEATTIPALQNAMSIYGIDELEEGKLTVVIPDKATFRSLSDMLNVADESGYKKLHEVFFQGKGVDAATGKEVVLKKVWEYGEDTVVVYDGWSAVMEAITFKTQADWDKDGGGKDKRNMYQIGQNYVSKFFNILDSVKAHLIVTAHSQIADGDAQAKFKGLKPVNPNLYTKSLAIPICGKYSWVFYAKCDTISGKFSLSLAESSAYTRSSMDRVKFKEISDVLNRTAPVHNKITLSNLPTDLTHEVFNLFPTTIEEE